MPWVELFAVFLVCHLVGDFLLQTDWQANNKHGGLGADAVARRALVSHVTVYTLCFVPAFVWICGERGFGWALAAAGLVFLPHLIQDDRRLLHAYSRRVKGRPGPTPALFLMIDQSFHVVALFGLALWVGY